MKKATIFLRISDPWPAVAVAETLYVLLFSYIKNPARQKTAAFPSKLCDYTCQQPAASAHACKLHHPPVQSYLDSQFRERE